VQKFVADYSLHMKLGLAVLLYERKIDEHARFIASRYGKGGHPLGKLNRHNLQQRATSEGILVNQFSNNCSKQLLVHA
jgi:hypothetical protein